MAAVELAALPVPRAGRYFSVPPRFEMFRYFELLFNSVTLDAGTDAVELRCLGNEALQLTPVGPNLYRATDRVVASHALLSSGGAADTITDGTHTLRKVSGIRYALNWISLVLGVIGLLTLLVVIQIDRVRRKEPLTQPASLALVLLLMPLPLFALQPFTALGDVTLASVALYVATLVLPLLLVMHSVWVYRNRQRVRSWLLHRVAAVFVLQWCVSLYFWDLLPFALLSREALIAARQY